jgi:hypothetical protein
MGSHIIQRQTILRPVRRRCTHAAAAAATNTRPAAHLRFRRTLPRYAQPDFSLSPNFHRWLGQQQQRHWPLGQTEFGFVI